MPSRWSTSCCTTRAWKPSTSRWKGLPLSSRPSQRSRQKRGTQPRSQLEIEKDLLQALEP